MLDEFNFCCFTLRYEGETIETKRIGMGNQNDRPQYCIMFKIFNQLCFTFISLSTLKTEIDTVPIKNEIYRDKWLSKLFQITKKKKLNKKNI